MFNYNGILMFLAGIKGKHSPRRSRSRLPRWLRPRSSGSLSDSMIIMSEGQETRAERIARYKEERRRQLASQFGTQSDPLKKTKDTASNSSSNSDGPRSTRTSRLRANVTENRSSPTNNATINSKEKSRTSSNGNHELNSRIERDKSSKRKSNLNRALNCEEVASIDDDVKSRRRRRRFFPQEIFNQNASTINIDDKTKNDISNTATTSLQSSSTSQFNLTNTKTNCNKKSELSVHMENARKGITPSYSEIGKYKIPPTKRGVITKISNQKETLKPSTSNVDSCNKEIPRRSIKTSTKTSNSLDTNVKTNRNIAKKMENLTALTKETLARVERLTTKTKESLKTTCIGGSNTNKSSDSGLRSIKNQQPSSILKKKSIEEPPIETVPNHLPVSILKRKVSQDDHNQSSVSSSTHTPPVTFSPNVVEPTTTNRRQGILKKRRSLDESQVMRHRSCSPDVVNKTTDSRSILKNQRRSSLEELRRTQSPETPLHGILKRKTLRNDDEDQSLNSPQSILKRRSGASSAGSTNSTPHVSITTAVILAAAGGAEMILESSEPVKPILKKKSFSEEHSYNDNLYSDIPKPILKKKSSTDTDECEEKPKKPILKISKNSNDNLDISDNDGDFKPVLKQGRDEFPRPRLSFCSNNSNNDDIIIKPHARRSNTICTEFNIKSREMVHDEDRELKKPRPLSVSELVMNFENSTVSTGAIPKRSSLKRRNDRCKTQPVTSNELEASLNLVEGPRLTKPPTLNDTTLLNYTTSLENDSKLNTYFSTSFHITSPDSGVKMSSDSAFQSLGDGLELDQDDDNLNNSNDNNTPTESCLRSPKLELQMKAIADEAKKIKRDKDKSSQSQIYRNRRNNSGDQRFSTQPVTFNEVQEASRLKENLENYEEQDEIEPSELSLIERIRLFNEKLDKKIPQKRDVPRNRLNRFSTQPVTSNEVETARSLPVKTHALDEKSTERKGILKSNQSTLNRLSGGSSPLLTPKSVLKRRDSLTRLNQTNEISDITYDEGISCNDSGSDSENASVSFTLHKNIDIERYSRSVSPNKYQSSETSDGGESSGSREVRNIFKSENKLRVKQALESVLSKSKSPGIVGDEQGDTNIRKTTIRRSQTQTGMPRTIAELQAKLQESGESSWKKRLQQNNNPNDELKSLKDKNKYNDELSEKSILALKKDELDAAAQQWKQRVEKSDAQKFSVAGRMEKSKDGKIDELPINIPLVDNNKRTPLAKRYKGKEDTSLLSTPVSPNKSNINELTRSFSVPERNQEPTGTDNELITGRKVSIIKPDDDTFTSFFKNIEEIKTTERLDITADDFDSVTRQSLLVQKKNIQIQKRRGASRNPIKALATRTDIVNEYTEILTGVAEREKKRLNIEKLAKSSNLAIEALAGLASKEDFANVALKKSTLVSALVPYKSVMLLHVKGRRHVQTRLVEPSVSSINEGDNFILVTSNALYNYIGAYANVIEQSRAADIINYVQQTGDLGCKVNEVITINAKNSTIKTRQINEFWKILGCNETQTFTDGGNPSEDEIYESNILSTNMIYKLENNELVPFDEYWGTIPKIEMLQPTRVLVFDFGTEMYVWSGKNAAFDEKRRALKLAKELWDEGYNYSDCNICPINIASILGDRPILKDHTKIGKRPEWAMFAKITQYRETILFKEKFLDWPDFSRVIRIKRDDNDNKLINPSYDIRPCDVELMLNRNETEPDLIVEGYHLGRGNKYFDEETKRLFEFDTLDLTMWRILENHSERLCDKSLAHFYDGDSYIIRWCYRMTVKGRELSGKPSKHAQIGRDRCIYFCWQGTKSSINEKGSAALLTVELDSENAPQIRVVQGLEPAAFLGIFNGKMVVHIGKRDELENCSQSRLFMVKGELEREVSLIEIPCNCQQLRSRTSFVLINCEDGEIYIWHGAKSSKQTRKVCEIVVDRIADEKPKEFHLNNFDDIDIIEVNEGDENNKFFYFIENNSQYYSLFDSNLNYDYTMRLFYLSSLSGTFKATEILCPYRSHFSSPYPFLQSDLYSASQPALFLIDNHHELWLWQGWWPETEENIELSEQTGSGAVRWQAERKAAMQTAVQYWRKSHGDGGESIPAYLVWAGFEPLEFKNLFPTWIDNDEVIELNSKEAKRKDFKVPIEKELAVLSRSTYSLSELLQRPLPEGVDPTQLEIYLSPEDFQEALTMSREEFQKLPLWKQTAIKKEKGLF